MMITLNSLAFTCASVGVLILLFHIFLKYQGMYKYLSLQCLKVLCLVILVRLFCPFEINLIHIQMKQNAYTQSMSMIQNHMHWTLILWALGVFASSFVYVYKVNKMGKMKAVILKNSRIIYDYRYPVVLSGIVSYPLVFGFKKCIYLPDLDYSEKEMEYILEHESKHIEFHDVLFKHFVYLVSILYWWFIPIYVFRKDIDLFLELRADEKVIQNKTKDEQYDYFESLIKISKKQSESDLIPLNLSSSLTNELSYRVHYFLSFSTKKRNPLFGISLIVCLISVCSAFCFIEPIVQKKVSPAMNSDVSFDYLNEEDTVLSMPGGGWFHGQGEVQYGFMNMNKEHYNSDTDKNAIHVKDLEEK